MADRTWQTLPLLTRGGHPRMSGPHLIVYKREGDLSTDVAKWIQEVFEKHAIREENRFIAMQVADDGAVSLVPTTDSKAGVRLRRRYAPKNGPPPPPSRLYLNRIKRLISEGDRIPLEVTETPAPRILLVGVNVNKGDTNNGTTVSGEAANAS